MRRRTSRRASASAGIRTAIARLAVRGGYGLYYTQIRTNAIAGSLTGGLDGYTTYTATPGQLGFPTCLTGPCLPLQFDPKTLPASQLPARDITIRAGEADFYRAQFASYGLNFDLIAPNYPDEFVNPRSQVTSIGVEREVMKGLFVGGDYVNQHWTDLDRTIDLNAPAPFDRTAIGQTRTVAAANATRPILPVNGGIRQVNVLTNLGESDYNALQTPDHVSRPREDVRRRSATRCRRRPTPPSLTATASAPNQNSLARLGEEERGPSVVDQRHRAVITFTYQLPLNITAGTVTQLASARPFNAVTGIDNNGDGANNDRPVVDGKVIAKSAFRGTGTQDVSVFFEGRIKPAGQHDPAARRRLQPVQPRQHPRPRADDLRRHRGGEHDVRPGRRGGHGDQRHPGAGEHRSAANVPVPDPLPLLTGSRAHQGKIGGGSISMRATRFALVAVVLAWAHIASAQTADEVIEKSITAMGGRAAMEKIKTAFDDRNARVVDAGRRHSRHGRESRTPRRTRCAP